METSVPGLTIAALVVVGMLLRPWGSREWHWALGGALAVMAARAETPASAWLAVAGGASVFAFLAGIAVVAEIARAGGVFDALAARARAAAGTSRSRLFLLVFASAAIVTALLSNDTTALVLTPAIFAVLAASGVDPVPYLYACAFVANAASFVLPFSNPANLVLYAGRLPALGPWLGTFGLAAVGAVLLTYALLRLVFKTKLHKPLAAPVAVLPMTRRTRLTAALTGVCAVGMVVAAALGRNVGLATLLLAFLSLVVVTVADRSVLATAVRRLPWQIVPLVGGLFVVVDALDRIGVLGMSRALLTHAAALSPPAGRAGAALGAAIASAALNNLPVAMAVARSAASNAAPVFHAVVAGVDLGPNLCVTGSLSTLLWLIAVRREGLDISAAGFFSVGLRAGLPALLLAALLVLP